LCKDIPEEACLAQPQNFTTHVMSLAATKTGDGLADPKLVLAWLLGALGAPQAAIGLLVPVREAGALLPQLFTSDFLRIAEEIGATAGGVNAADGLWGQFAYLKDDPQLVRLIAVRALLVATALAPPFLLALAGQSGGRELAAIGPFFIDSALASVVSGYVRGRFADHSSRQVLMTGVACGGVVLGVTAFIAFAMPTLTT
jgi:hypothetical protein